MDLVVNALADAVRRDILVMLRHERLPAGEIAARFEISRPAVSRHLRVLRDSGLVHDELVGRQRFYALDAGGFAEVADWLAQFTRPAGWQHRLDALATEVHRTRRERAAARNTGDRDAAGRTVETEESEEGTA